MLPNVTLSTTVVPVKRVSLAVTGVYIKFDYLSCFKIFANLLVLIFSIILRVLLCELANDHNDDSGTLFAIVAY